MAHGDRCTEAQGLEMLKLTKTHFFSKQDILFCCFFFRYKHDKNALIVSVVRCRDLPAKDPNLGSSDPYVKLQLLPDKQHKVKTRVLRKTRNPVYDEDFTFYGIGNVGQLTLKFAVEFRFKRRILFCLQDLTSYPISLCTL